MRRPLLYASILAAALAVSLSILLPQVLHQSFKPRIEVTPTPLRDFTLIDQDGREFSLSSVRGKPVFLFFGYSNCPDVCPLVMYKFAYTLRGLGDQAEGVAFIFITQDPWRDTPEALKKWIERFDARIIALTGSPEQLLEVWRAYNVPVVYTDENGNKIENPEEYARAGKPYFLTHTGFVFVAGRDHTVRYGLTSDVPEGEYLEMARYVLTH